MKRVNFRAVSAAIALVLVAGAGAAFARSKGRMVPVVVAARDIAVGEIITFDMISQRSVPEELVTSSLVKPDAASYVVNQPAQLPILTGDFLHWSMFETAKKAESTKKCGEMVQQGKTATEQVARIRVNALKK